MLMMRDGVSDMYCMIDTCLIDELEMEYTRMQNTDWSMAIILAMKLWEKPVRDYLAMMMCLCSMITQRKLHQQEFVHA